MVHKGRGGVFARVHNSQRIAFQLCCNCPVVCCSDVLQLIRSAAQNTTTQRPSKQSPVQQRTPPFMDICAGGQTTAGHPTLDAVGLSSPSDSSWVIAASSFSRIPVFRIDFTLALRFPPHIKFWVSLNIRSGALLTLTFAEPDKG